jgi:hypothetical protein
MNLQYRIDLLARLGTYILSDEPSWLATKEKASYENAWFIPSFIELASNSIAKQFLQKELLVTWAATYEIPETKRSPKLVGIVMAGNIPLVGFHDFLCVFISGHRALIKSSSKDDVLFRHLLNKLIEWDPAVGEVVQLAEMLKGCDAYIATGSNNSAGYFDYYFAKFPNIIRRNRTSVAILTGNESTEELDLLADDVFLYFGLGCRNVTKIFVPHDYDFIPLLAAFKKYEHLVDQHKYKHNYDYNLAIHLLNRQYYMSTPAILLVENPSVFSPVSQLHYEYYSDDDILAGELQGSAELQCIVGQQHLAFGSAQSPSLTDYADGVDTMQFVMSL